MVASEDWTSAVSVEQARELLLDAVVPIKDMETLPLLDAVGSVLGTGQFSAMDQPPFRRSPLDGYALLSSDTSGASRQHPAALRVIDHICAGQVSDKRVTEGTAVRLMTGAPVPEGADCVVRQEDTDYDSRKTGSLEKDSDLVRVYTELAHEQNIIPAGDDFRRGTVLAEKGEIVTADVAGVLAAAGIDRIPVIRRPRVAVITSGDELIAPGQPLPPGKIYNSNQMVLAGRLKEWKAELTVMTTVGDDPAYAARTIADACRRSDLVITTGGVSVGEKDIMHDVWKMLHARRLFWRISVKPGMPTMAYVYEGTPVLALSGNPFASLVLLELLAAPALSKLSGDSRIFPEERIVTSAGDFKAHGRKRRIIRAYAEGNQVTLPQRKQRNGSLLSDKCANCFADIPEGTVKISAGTKVRVWIPGRIR